MSKSIIVIVLSLIFISCASIKTTEKTETVEPWVLPLAGEESTEKFYISELPETSSDNELIPGGPSASLSYYIRKGNLAGISQVIDEHGKQIVNTPIGSHSKTLPLILAVSEGKTEVVAVLLRYGANPNMRGDYQETAFDVAKRKILAAEYQDDVESLSISQQICRMFEPLVGENCETN